MLGSQKCIYILRFSHLSNQSLWVGKCCGWEFVHFLSDEKFSTFPKRRRRQQWRLSCTCFLRLPLVWKGAKYLFNIFLMSTLYLFCFFLFPLVWKGAKYLFNIFFDFYFIFILLLLIPTCVERYKEVMLTLNST